MFLCWNLKTKTKQHTIHLHTSPLTAVGCETESILSDLFEVVCHKRTPQDLKIEMTDSFHGHEVERLALV